MYFRDKTFLNDGFFGLVFGVGDLDYGFEGLGVGDEFDVFLFEVGFFDLGG